MNLNYRQQITFMGMLIGAALGAIGALVWLDHLSGREIPKTQATTIGFGDMARLATATVALVRQVNEMTREKDRPAE
jgi:hypothetical protein